MPVACFYRDQVPFMHLIPNFQLCSAMLLHIEPRPDFSLFLGPFQRIGWYCVIPRFGGSFLRMKRTKEEGKTSTNYRDGKNGLNVQPPKQNIAHLSEPKKKKVENANETPHHSAAN